MKFLVIGLGSMGKRRVRCLQKLGYSDITGFDPRNYRRDESHQKYGIKVIEELAETDFADFDAIIISTPPDLHSGYMNLSIKYKKPAFVEASVILDDLPQINADAKEQGVFIAPSCTLQFHPIIKDIKQIIQSGKYGKVTNFTYHSGNFLPDWHPWENVQDFYVSNRSTGGGREIVPFELTWICNILGFPEDIKGYFSKTMNVGADIEDSYAFTMDFGNMLGAMIVDVTARYAIRNLVLNLEKGQILWRWDHGFFDLYESDNNRFIRYEQPMGQAESGYNKNIIEEMYVDEVRAFISQIKGTGTYPSNLDFDIKILNLLNNIENSDGGFKR
jgi:predicted dehydrogenase